MAAYVPVIGDTIVPDGITEAHSIIQILHWIGFRIEENRNNLIEDSLGSYGDILMLKEKDIPTMATDWGSRTQANGRMHFGARRTKLLKALTHWRMDFERVSTQPSITGLNEHTFKTALITALTRADIRKSLSDRSSSAADAASPGPLESERKWKQWEEKFVNYTSCHIGTFGIPLSYIIRESEAPNLDGDFVDFTSKTIACAPLNGEFYRADTLTVFNMIVSFTTGQPSGDWIKQVVRFSDGRRCMQALRDHFAGEGNATRNMAEADRLKDSLHYKSERSMTFETFLTQCQKMYNIYKKEGEPMPDDAKTRFLFKKVQHSGLRSSIDALKAQQTAGTNITYTMAANHLSTAVSELPEYVAKNQNISAANAKGSDPSSEKASSAIYNPDGSVITGHIPSWRSLSQSDREKVLAERKRLGIKGGRGGKNAKGGDKASSNRLKQLTEQNNKYRRQIKALKRSQSKDDDKSDDGDDSNSSVTDAGDQFGGRASKRAAKKSKNK